MGWQNLAPMQDAVQTLFKDTRPLGGSRLHPGSWGGSLGRIRSLWKPDGDLKVYGGIERAAMRTVLNTIDIIGLNRYFRTAKEHSFAHKSEDKLAWDGGTWGEGGSPTNLLQDRQRNLIRGCAYGNHNGQQCQRLLMVLHDNMYIPMTDSGEARSRT